MRSRQSYILLFFFLFSSFVSFGQTRDDYIKGYKDGFQKGYCQYDNQCDAPVPRFVNPPRGAVLQYPIGYAKGIEDGRKKKIDENKNNNQSDEAARDWAENQAKKLTPKARQPQPVKKPNTKISRSPYSIKKENLGYGLIVGYDVGISGGIEYFFDSWMFGLNYGSRVLEDNSDTYATEEKIYGTIGFKLTNFMYLKGGVGTYYQESDNYAQWSSGSLLYPSYDDIDRFYDDIYSQYDNTGATYLQIGIQFFIHINNSALTPEIFYSNAGGTVGVGFGIVF